MPGTHPGTTNEEKGWEYRLISFAEPKSQEDQIRDFQKCRSG